MNEIASKLRNMKTALGLSNKELSDLSGVPIGTVNRVLAGRVETPNFQTIRDLVKAMGGSLDDISGIAPAPAEESPEPDRTPAGGLPPEAVHAYSVLLQEKQNEIESRDKWLKRLFVICCILAGIIIAVLLFDLINPSIGYFTQ